MKAPALARKRAAFARGRVGELAALIWLMAKGYRILARRARTPFGEIDIAALKGGVLTAVEVKTRRGAGFDAVGPRQKDRTLRAAEALAHRFRLRQAPIRIDLVIVRPWRLPQHIRDAWREGDARL